MIFWPLSAQNATEWTCAFTLLVIGAGLVALDPETFLATIRCYVFPSILLLSSIRSPIHPAAVFLLSLSGFLVLFLAYFLSVKPPPELLSLQRTVFGLSRLPSLRVLLVQFHNDFQNERRRSFGGQGSSHQSGPQLKRQRPERSATVGCEVARRL